MKQRIELQVESRNSGKHFSRALRNEKKVPAIVYGSTKEPINVSLRVNDVLKYNTRAYENALFNLKSTDTPANDKVALIKSVDVHPATRRPLHVDLFVIDMNKPVRVSVEIQFDGKPIGLAEGGLLNIVNRQIEIECKPAEIPEKIVADVSHLGLGDVLHTSDLKIPNGIKVISATELTLAVVNLAEEEAVAAPTAVAADAAAPAAGAKAAAAPAKGAAAPAAGKAPAAAGKAPAAKAPEKKK
ncbi:MAG TPA: 50S ribosomal protein L25 [Pseudobdellovibrionaceae bacterium]|nr:50S ribosomal protein L25 [Pseudobdellovibrionaceae bacterium]